MHRDKSHDLLRDGFAEAHRRVREAATGDASGMGTTLVAAFVRRNTAIIAHTGDSRAYHLSGRIVSVTTDHSLVCDMVERGLLDPCELFHHRSAPILHGVSEGISLLNRGYPPPSG